MKTKRRLALLLAVAMLLCVLSGCGGKETAGKDSPGENKVQNSVDKNHQQEQADNQDKPQKPEKGELVNEDGIKFTVNLENKGGVVPGVPVSSNEIVLAGKSYSFPIDLSKAFDNGWHLQDSAKEIWDWEFKEESEYDLSGVSLFYDDFSDFDVVRAYNPTQEVKDIYGCQMLEMRMLHFNNYVYSDFDFVLPGGITQNSTAADVLAAFGNPNTTTDFESGKSFDDSLRYINHKQTGMSFSFDFKPDGTLRKLTVEVESPKEINNTGR